MEAEDLTAWTEGCQVVACTTREVGHLHRCGVCYMVCCRRHNGGVWDTPMCLSCRTKVANIMKKASTAICATCWSLDAEEECDGCQKPLCSACHYRGEGACRPCHEAVTQELADNGRPSTPVNWDAEPEQPCRVCGKAVPTRWLVQCGCRRWICRGCDRSQGGSDFACPECCARNENQKAGVGSTMGNTAPDSEGAMMHITRNQGTARMEEDGNDVNDGQKRRTQD